MLCLDEHQSGLGDEAEGILDGRQVTSQVAFFFELMGGTKFSSRQASGKKHSSPFNSNRGGGA